MAKRRRAPVTDSREAPPAEESLDSGPFSERGSGILLHLTSLPGPHCNGDLGSAAHRFIRFLENARQTWWQMLPVGPPGRDNSPYDSESSFAGSPLLVSLEELSRDGWLSSGELVAPARNDASRVDYDAARRFRDARLRLACQGFSKKGGFRSAAFRAFEDAAHHWLADYALFCALRGAHGNAPWVAWDPELSARKPRALDRARRELAEEIGFQQFVQYAFARQWTRLRDACRASGVRLLGDVPMFVAHNSADVWANPELFHLDRRGAPTVVAGVPPDYFSRTGQLWGNPIYRWDFLTRTGFAWWLARFAAVLERFDAVRLDHFIGLYRYWEVPARARTAMHGRFVEVPGARLLTAAQHELGRLPLVAEDLGLVVPQVVELRERFALPGMRVLEFGFGDATSDREHQPHHYPTRLVAYTGTHDNDTLVGWFREQAPRGDSPRAAELARRRSRVMSYASSDGREIHWDLIRLVLMSPANTAIVPLQDLLGLGSQARMNTPGTSRGNWEWRTRPEELRASIATRMRGLVDTYERAALSVGRPRDDHGKAGRRTPRPVRS